MLRIKMYKTQKARRRAKYTVEKLKIELGKYLATFEKSYASNIEEQLKEKNVPHNF